MIVKIEKKKKSLQTREEEKAEEGRLKRGRERKKEKVLEVEQE